MECRHGLEEQLADLPVVVGIGDFLQGGQVLKELVLVQGDGVADMDQVVPGLLHAFLSHELLFVELLAGAQARVFDPDVDVGFQAGFPDQVPGQGIDLHRAAHIQDEDLAAFGVDAGQHDQGDGLGNGHEVADDVRVGHGHRAALLDLLLEDGYHAAVAAQDVAETHGHVFRLCRGKVDVFLLDFGVGVDLGDLRCLPGLDHLIEGLDDHLAQALAGAHDVGGVHGLVRGDQDEALRPEGHGRVGGLVRADGVVLDGLTGAVLHQGHMLVGRRVEDDLWPVFVKHLEDPPAVPDGTDQGHQVQVREVLLQLVLDVVGVVLVDVEDDEFLWLVSDNLPAQLRPDGAAAAGHQHGLALEVLENLRHVGFDGGPAQQVLHSHFLQGGDRDLAFHQLVHARQLLDLAVGFVADVQQVPLRPGGGAGHRQEDRVDFILLHRVEDVLPAAHDLHAGDIPAHLVRIVVDQADDLVPVALLPDIPEDRRAGVAGADEHDPLPGGAAFGQELDEIYPETLGEADGQQTHALQQSPNQVIGDRHALVQEGDQQNMQEGCHQGREGCMGQHGNAGKGPYRFVHIREQECHDAQRRIDRDKLEIRVQIAGHDPGKHKVKADPQRHEPGGRNHKHVQQNHDPCNNLPFLYVSAVLLLLLLCFLHVSSSPGFPGRCCCPVFLYSSAIHRVRSS